MGKFLHQISYDLRDNFLYECVMKGSKIQQGVKLILLTNFAKLFHTIYFVFNHILLSRKNTKNEILINFHSKIDDISNLKYKY